MQSEQTVLPIGLRKAYAALKMLFVADALAMPVHWYYNTLDIERAFPGGVRKLEDAPSHHPSSIMSLHSRTQGGRKGTESTSGSQIVGDVILKGRADLWNKKNIHYHHQMKAGENTLNAQCVRVLIRSMTLTGGQYSKEAFLDAYIQFMTADPPLHHDTYAESYHRGFFANLMSGKPKDQCGAVTHDTPSVGGLVSIAPLVFAGRLSGQAINAVQKTAKAHLFLTHPDDSLARICSAYIELIDKLLFLKDAHQPREVLETTARQTVGLDLATLVARARNDAEVVGRQFSSACYISGSWPSILYLAHKYLDDP
ncbi:MAG: ADP-ribosylglycohydrolase family protein, partial [Deltaproteobacteria bacterium]|nr:ADP-ribosylglycohydrolase family protein [Deltaproteobacteria bacterium]